MRGLRSAAILLAVILSAVSAFVVTPPQPTLAQYEELIARARSAVVVVRYKDLFGRSGHGSGFIYDPSGYILTNHHVSEGAEEITVTLPDRRTFPATIVDYIRKNDYACPPRVETWTDAAVLKINGSGLPTIPMGDSSTLRQGQEVLVLGYPGGVSTEEVSASRGIVGAVRPGWFQTDAVIIPGNSGGPVINRQGRAVGLAAFGVGLYFRIGGVVGINSVKPMAAAALSPGGQRFREFKITGIEYVPAVTVGRRRVFRRMYEPGSTGGSPSSGEFSTEVTQVQNFSGSFLYVVRSSDGSESRNFLDAEGLHSVGSVGGGWRVVHPELSLTFAFPPCVGVTWQYRWRAEHPDDRITRQGMSTVRVEGASESVTVPAGTYTDAIRTVTVTQGTDVRASESRSWREVEVTWWVAGVGVVREVTENPDTRQRWISDLVQAGIGPITAAPPPPPPPPPEPGPPPPSEPAPPPPQVARLAPNDREIVPGERIGAARVGDVLDDVMKVIGEAPTAYRSERPGQPTGWIGYQWKTRVYVVVDKQSRVIMRAGVYAQRPEEITQPPFVIRGVGLGAWEVSVRAAFGAPSSRQNFETYTLFVYNSAGIGFYIGTSPQFLFNGQVFEIVVFKPGTF